MLAKDTTLSPFGTFRDAIAINPGAPLGPYRIRLWQPGGSEFAGGFEVQTYQLEKLGLEFDLPKTVFYRGEIVRATLKARYGYDAPASGRPIEVALPDGRTVRGQTDAQGQFAIEFPTEGFGEDQALRIVARLPADNVAAARSVRVAVQGFAITLSTPRQVYLDGETFNLAATTLDALGEPTGQALRVAVIKPVTQENRTVEREVSSKSFTTDKATGQGQVALRIEEVDRTGYILRVAGTDQFGHPVVTDYSVTISGKNDDQKLRILADRTRYKVGETASVRLVNRAKGGTALVAWEADRILRYQLVPIGEGENRLDWSVDGPEFPNFTLTASRMADQRFDEARFDVVVERDLRVSLQPKTARLGPGAEVEVEVTTVDQMGRPVAAEIALALVDQTLLRQFRDKLPPIGAFFYDQTRLGAFTTESTITFADHPTTEPVPDAVVDEDERQVALARAADRQQWAAGMAAKGYVNNQPGQALAAPMAAAPAPVDQIQMGAQGIPMAGFEPRLGGMGGGMGGLNSPAQPNRSMGDMVTSADEAEAGQHRLEFDRGREGMRYGDARELRLDKRKESGSFEDIDRTGARGRPRSVAPAKLRRDRLLEPVGRDRGRRQGNGQVPGARGIVGIPADGQGGDGRRHPRRPRPRQP